MSKYYNKDSLKESLEPEQIFELLDIWGANPEYYGANIIAQTICHNSYNEGSHKLYYYTNTKLFVCYSNCGTFDIFDLCIKVMHNQKEVDWELYDAMAYIAGYFGFDGEQLPDDEEQELEDWDVFRRHDFQLPQALQVPVLPEYNPVILTRFSYPRILAWEREGITEEVSRRNLIGYYPGGEQVVIPHFDINGRLIGIRGRFLAEDMSSRYGKYRPLAVNRQLYNHPLSMNLYHIQASKDNIAKRKVAILFEGKRQSRPSSLYQLPLGLHVNLNVANGEA